jgi:hypothetical protein
MLELEYREKHFIVDNLWNPTLQYSGTPKIFGYIVKLL